MEWVLFSKYRHPIYSLTLATLHSPTTKYIAMYVAIDGQVCFHRGLFADPVNSQGCTTRPVEPLQGFTYGTKLLIHTYKHTHTYIHDYTYINYVTMCLVMIKETYKLLYILY